MEEDSNIENANAEDYEIYFVARDEETEEEMSFNSFSTDDQPNDEMISETSEHNALIDYQNEQSQESTETSINDEEASNLNETERRMSYNRNLTAFHSYLGNQFEELTGRVVLEEESYFTLPILCLPHVSIVLVPGQLLPLQFEGDYLISKIKSIIDGTKIFGLMPDYTYRNVNLKNYYNEIELGRLGTVVEVRSYGTEFDEDNDRSILKIKAEGKERFILKETFTQSGTLFGKVFILPEINNKHLYHKNIHLSSLGGSRFNKRLLPALTPFNRFTYDLYDSDYLMEKIRGHLNQWASFTTNNKSNDNDGTQQRSNVYENRTVSQTTGTIQPPSTEIVTNSSNETNATESNSATNQPNIINSTINDDEIVSVNTTRTVVTRIIPVNENSDEESEEEDSEEYGFKSYAPSDPLKFSYWVVANLPLEDHQRLILLSFNSTIQRLRWESSFFEKYLSLSCMHCNIFIANCEDIFSMSVNGYQDVFVNSHGAVHDTLTLSKVNNTRLRGEKSSEYSWYPNYSWIIMYCNQCRNHLGWKFVANNKKLSPQFFFGISRQNIKPGINKSILQNNEIENLNPII